MAGAAFLLDAVRTPFGRYGGALGGVRPVRTTGSSHSPVEAARRALKRAGIGREDLTYVELNEAFAAQSRACLAEWPDLDPERVNALGGAIAIGHPLGASGTRVLGSLVHGLVAAGRGWGLAAICTGVGQGLAVVVEA